MRVPSHQIYNILNIYSKWVSKNGESSLEKFNGDSSTFDGPRISADRYRRSIMQKVSVNIVSKLTCLESSNKRSHAIAERLKDYEGKNGKLDEIIEEKFIYNAIDQGRGKTKNILLIDKSCFLARQAERKKK